MLDLNPFWISSRHRDPNRIPRYARDDGLRLTAHGFSLAAAGVSMILVQGTLTRVAIPKLGERRAAMVGLGFGAAGYLVYAAASAGWMMFVGLAVFALGGLVYPSINGLMSKQAGADEQGALQGAIGSLYGLTEIVGPIVMTQLFAIFSGPSAPFLFPGAPFGLAAVLALAALALVLAGRRQAVSGEPANQFDGRAI